MFYTCELTIYARLTHRLMINIFGEVSVGPRDNHITSSFHCSLIPIRFENNDESRRWREGKKIKKIIDERPEK